MVWITTDEARLNYMRQYLATSAAKGVKRSGFGVCAQDFDKRKRLARLPRSSANQWAIRELRKLPGDRVWRFRIGKKERCGIALSPRLIDSMDDGKARVAFGFH